ncbi:MAG: signal peptidase II [Oscillospiraceae bacterium]|jgi:signal peptidase II|nr:signal peptidase II [Oscillospiraceae bacterium]
MLYALIVAALIAADQGLKYWVVSHLSVGQSAPLLPGVMQLTRLHNTGAAWSSFSGMTAVLAVVTVVLMALVLWLLIKKIVRHPLGVAGCLLILGGGMGNLIDRIFRGYVVDMFDLLLFQYPIFNLADCFVVVGAVLGAIYYLFLYEKTDRREKPHDPDADGHK